jgi:hypothetical protein
MTHLSQGRVGATSPRFAKDTATAIFLETGQ